LFLFQRVLVPDQILVVFLDYRHRHNVVGVKML